MHSDPAWLEPGFVPLEFSLHPDPVLVPGGAHTINIAQLHVDVCVGLSLWWRAEGARFGGKSHEVIPSLLGRVGGMSDFGDDRGEDEEDGEYDGEVADGVEVE